MDDNQVRKDCQKYLNAFLKEMSCDGDVERKMQQKQEQIVYHQNGPIAALPSKANEQMYEITTELFQLVLGKRMKCSCALFTVGEESLDEAQEAMLDLVCQRSQLQNGMKVMDLGCGWGALTFWILEKYKNCHVTCVSNSKTQKIYIDAIAKEKGVSEQVNCITADVNDFDTTEKFDRVISFEMFEYMKNYDLLLAKIAKWLKEDGILFIHTLGHHEYAYNIASKSKDKENSVATKRFLGVHSVSPDLLLYFQKDLVISKHWILRGSHFSKTSQAWLKKFDDAKLEALEILSKAYGRDNAESHFNEWRQVLLHLESYYGFNDGNEFVASHKLFRKRP